MVRKLLRYWNGYKTALVIIILLSITAQRLWVNANQAPPELSDDADHLLASLLLYKTLSQHGLQAFIAEAFNTVSHFYHPPLIPALTAPLYAWLGPSVGVALWFNVLCLVLLYVYVFKLAKQLIDERHAVFAVAVLALFPLTYGLERLYLLELGLATIVVIWLYYFYRSDGLTNARYLPWLGLLLGGGLLTKATFPMYIVGPVILEMFRKAGMGTRAAWQIVGRILLVGSLGGLLALPWYVRHIDGVWRGTKIVVAADSIPSEARGVAHSGETFTEFFADLIISDISVYFVLLGLILFLICLAARPRDHLPDRAQPRLSARDIHFLLAWWIPPFLICLFSAFKVSRYLYPAHPVLAILLSVAVVRALPSSPLRRALVVGSLLIIPIGNFLQLSFFDVWTRLPERVLAIDRIRLVQTLEGYGFTYRPRSDRWPFEMILETLREHATQQPSQDIRADMYYKNFTLTPSNIAFLARSKNMPVTIFPHLCHPEEMPTQRCLNAGLPYQTYNEFLIIEWPTGDAPTLDDLVSICPTPYRRIAIVSLPEEMTTEVVIYQRVQLKPRELGNSPVN